MSLEKRRLLTVNHGSLHLGNKEEDGKATNDERSSRTEEGSVEFTHAKHFGNVVKEDKDPFAKQSF